MFLNNKREQRGIRTLLRRNATPQEVILWSRLKRSQLGFKFRRQTSIGNYILDFYCPRKQLAIEIDGSQHIDSSSDAERTAFLNAHGVQVLRFWNNEVNTNLEGVLLKIVTTLNPSSERRKVEKDTTTP